MAPAPATGGDHRAPSRKSPALTQGGTRIPDTVASDRLLRLGAVGPPASEWEAATALLGPDTGTTRRSRLSTASGSPAPGRFALLPADSDAPHLFWRWALAPAICYRAWSWADGAAPAAPDAPGCRRARIAAVSVEGPGLDRHPARRRRAGVRARTCRHWLITERAGAPGPALHNRERTGLTIFSRPSLRRCRPTSSARAWRSRLASFRHGVICAPARGVRHISAKMCPLGVSARFVVTIGPAATVVRSWVRWANDYYPCAAWHRRWPRFRWCRRLFKRPAQLRLAAAASQDALWRRGTGSGSPPDASAVHAFENHPARSPSCSSSSAVRPDRAR